MGRRGSYESLSVSSSSNQPISRKSMFARNKNNEERESSREEEGRERKRRKKKKKKKKKKRSEREEVETWKGRKVSL